MAAMEPREAFVSNAQIDEAEHFAAAVKREAGCPSDRCPSLTICEPCGGLVCAEHTVGVGTCVEVGEHHGSCFAGCEHCQEVREREQAEELEWCARSERESSR